MKEFWAKIEDDEITFYSRDYLAQKGKIEELDEMRKNYRNLE